MRMAFRICEDMACDAYASVLSTMRSVVSANGPLGLYGGVGATLIGALPFEGVKFGAYDLLKQILPKTDDGKTLPIWSLVAGAGAGALAHTVTYPLDTVRRRMQVSGAIGAARQYTGTFQCLQAIIVQEGWRALFLSLIHI